MSILRRSTTLYFLFLIVFVIIMGCSQFSIVHARALRNSSTTIPAAGVINIGSVIIKNGVEESSAELMVKISNEFVVSSSSTVFNSSSSNIARPSSRVRSLVFKLASGPSKRGPGH